MYICRYVCDIICVFIKVYLQLQAPGIVNIFKILPRNFIEVTIAYSLIIKTLIFAIRLIINALHNN